MIVTFLPMFLNEIPTENHYKQELIFKSMKSLILNSLTFFHKKPLLKPVKNKQIKSVRSLVLIVSPCVRSLTILISQHLKARKRLEINGAPGP